MRNIEFPKIAFEDFLEWETADKKTFKKVIKLIRESQRNPFEGEGNPEPLKHDFAGCWSKRIDLKHLLIFKVTSDKLIIIGCKGHYNDK